MSNTNVTVRRTGPVPVPASKRFRKHVTRNATRMDGMRSACDEWEAAYDSLGYPVFAEKPNSAGGIVKAHRYSYEQHYECKLEKGEVLVRVCKNPRCVKATHIKKKQETLD